MDIQQIMALLAAKQGAPGMGAQGGPLGGGGFGLPNPYGALQPDFAPPVAPGMAPGMPLPPDALMGGAPGMGPLGPVAGMAPPMMPPPAEPDYNAILQQKMLMQGQDEARQGMMQQLAERLGARTGGAMQFDPSMGRQGMKQQFRDWRQAGNQPVGFGAGKMGMRPPGGMGGAPGMTQPANTATLPMGGVQSALGADYMKKRQGMGGGGYSGEAAY